MRLTYKFTISYAVVTLIALAIGLTINYIAGKRSIFNATISKLERLHHIADSTFQTPSFDSLLGDNLLLQITPVDDSLINFSTDPSYIIKHTWSPRLLDSLNVIHYKSFINHNDKWYELYSEYAFVEADNEYLEAVIMVFLWTFVFLLSLVIVLGQLISISILKPFHKTLTWINNVRIDTVGIPEFTKNTTYEFTILNDFLSKMVNKAQQEYLSLKEFGENASHEIQTPLAVIKGKIELLMQTELKEEQFYILSTMMLELDNLSKIQRSLNLLTQLEHFEINPKNHTNLTALVKHAVDGLEGILELKNLQLSYEIAEDVNVLIDGNLALILVNNLINNAFKHNIESGIINITLNKQFLEIKNSGVAPAVPTHLLFERFRKGADTKGLGIGLAIVNKIVNLYNYNVSYEYISNLHIIRVDWSEGDDLV